MAAILSHAFHPLPDPVLREFLRHGSVARVTAALLQHVDGSAPVTSEDGAAGAVAIGSKAVPEGSDGPPVTLTVERCPPL